MRDRTTASPTSLGAATLWVANCFLKPKDIRLMKPTNSQPLDSQEGLFGITTKPVTDLLRLRCGTGLYRRR